MNNRNQRVAPINERYNPSNSDIGKGRLPTGMPILNININERVRATRHHVIVASFTNPAHTSTLPRNT